MVRRELRDCLGVGDRQLWDDAILSVSCTRCMQYLVYAVLSVWSSQCMQYSVYAVLGVCSTQFMQYSCMQDSVYAVLGVCSTRCMQYSVYAVLGVCFTRWQLLIIAWRDREWWLNFIFIDNSRVEDENERNGKRWGKSLWETGTWRMPCASQFTIPNTAGRSRNPACNYTDTRFFLPNLACCTPDFSYPLVSSSSFSSSSPIPLFLFHTSIIITEYKVK